MSEEKMLSFMQALKKDMPMRRISHFGNAWIFYRSFSSSDSYNEGTFYTFELDDGWFSDYHFTRDDFFAQDWIVMDPRKYKLVRREEKQ